MVFAISLRAGAAIAGAEPPSFATPDTRSDAPAHEGKPVSPAPRSFGLSPTWKSALLPGWGQLEKRHPGRAGLFAGAFLGSTVTAWIVTQRKNNAYTEYLYARETDAMAHHFDEATRYYRAQVAFTIASSAIWLAGILEARLSAPDADRHGAPAAALVPRAIDSGLALTLQVRAP